MSAADRLKKYIKTATAADAQSGQPTKVARSQPDPSSSSSSQSQQAGSAASSSVSSISGVTSATSSVPKPRIVNVIFQGNEGFENSVTHYYHFLFSAMFPLVEYHLLNKRVTGFNICTDLGPMKRLLCELPLNLLEMAGPNNTKSKVYLQDRSADRTGYVALPAYDNFTEGLFGHCPDNLSMKSLQLIKDYFASTIPPYIRLIPTHEIVLIERTDREKYFKDVETLDKNRHSGAEIRKIANHRALADALLSRYGAARFANLELEKASIYYQYHLFSQARVIIAQHGAALSNIVFMDTARAAVVEINPPPSKIAHEGFRQAARKHFLNLAKHIGLPRYYTVVQENEHSDIDVSQVLAYVEQALVDSVPDTITTPPLQAQAAVVASSTADTV